MKQIAQFECEFRDRDLIHIDLIAGSHDFRVLSQKFSVSSNDFKLVLIGKDGEVKLRTSNPSLEAVMTLIDSMPMRQQERRNGKCQQDD